MTNIIFFILGFVICQYKQKITEIIKQFCFLLRNYKMIKKSKYYNEFYEDYISSQDFERSDIQNMADIIIDSLIELIGIIPIFVVVAIILLFLGKMVK